MIASKLCTIYVSFYSIYLMVQTVEAEAPKCPACNLTADTKKFPTTSENPESTTVDSTKIWLDTCNLNCTNGKRGGGRRKRRTRRKVSRGTKRKIKSKRKSKRYKQRRKSLRRRQLGQEAWVSAHRFHPVWLI